MLRKAYRTHEKFLHHNNVNLVVSDIVPWIFKACRCVKVKSILISNFTLIAICANNPIIVIDRKEVAEYRKTVESLLNLALAIKNNEFNEKNI